MSVDIGPSSDNVSILTLHDMDKTVEVCYHSLETTSWLQCVVFDFVIRSSSLLIDSTYDGRI